MAVLGPVKGVIHDNLLFQGQTGTRRTLLQVDPGNDGCVLRNNSILMHSNRSFKSLSYRQEWVTVLLKTGF